MGNCFSHIFRSRVTPDHKSTTPAMERKSSKEKKTTRTGGQEVLDQEAMEEADTKLTTPEVAPTDISNTPPPAPRSRRNPAASRQTLPRLARSDAGIGAMQFGPPLAAASSRLSAATMLSIDPVAPSSQPAHNPFASTHTGPTPALLPGFPAGSGTYMSSGMMPGMQPAYNPFASNHPYAGYPFSPALNNSPSVPSGGVGMSGQPSSSFSAFGRPSVPDYYTSSRLSAMDHSNFDHMLQEQQATQNSNPLPQGSTISSSSSLAPSNSSSLEDRLAEAHRCLAELRARFSAAPPAFMSSPDNRTGSSMSGSMMPPPRRRAIFERDPTARLRLGLAAPPASMYSPDNRTGSSMPGSMMPPPRRRAIFERDPTAALRLGLAAQYPQLYNARSRDRQRRDYQGFVSIVTITEGICGVDEDWGEEYRPQTVVEQQADGTTNSHTAYTTFVRFDFRHVLGGH